MTTYTEKLLSLVDTKEEQNNNEFELKVFIKDTNKLSDFFSLIKEIKEKLN
jgi:hypothetical protein